MKVNSLLKKIHFFLKKIQFLFKSFLYTMPGTLSVLQWDIIKYYGT